MDEENVQAVGKNTSIAGSREKKKHDNQIGSTRQVATNFFFIARHTFVFIARHVAAILAARVGARRLVTIFNFPAMLI